MKEIGKTILPKLEKKTKKSSENTVLLEWVISLITGFIYFIMCMW